MSKVSADLAFERAIDLIKHADELTDRWTARLVATQTSLVIAEGALLGWRANTPGVLVILVALLIGGVAIASLCAISHIIMREHDYGHLYMEMAQRAEGHNPYLFQPGHPGLPGPKFSDAVKRVRVYLIVAWSFFLASVLIIPLAIPTLKLLICR